jgi:hypothetical protein
MAKVPDTQEYLMPYICRACPQASDFDLDKLFYCATARKNNRFGTGGT